MAFCTEKIIPAIGDYLLPDTDRKYKIGNLLTAGDEATTDGGFPGCTFRYETAAGHLCAVNIKVTGKPYFMSGCANRTRSRCKIEWVGDCEPSTFSGGWIYHSH
jgi:hypothetical protein